MDQPNPMKEDESKLIAHFQSLNSITLSRPREYEMSTSEACEAIARVSHRYRKIDLIHN